MNYSKLLEGKYAVITCGDSAIGVAIVRLFAEHGAAVVVGAKDVRAASKLISTIGSIPPDSFCRACDLADANSIEAFCSEVNRRLPLVNILVNNPWMEFDKAFEDADEDDDELILQVYQRSIMQTLRAFWPAMLKAGSCSVVNISSSSVFKAVQGTLLHTMANGAVGGMTRVPAVEGGVREVRVNEILTAYDSNCRMQANTAEDASSTEDASGTEVACTAGATNTAEDTYAVEVANAALFLAGDMASYVSGISLSVSGGLRRARFT